MKKLAIITTHPIQYNAPLFKHLARQNKLEVKVFYTLGQHFSGIIDKGFGKKINWDIPLLEGYTYEFVKNVSPKPGTSHFRGIINPELIQKIKSFGATEILIYGWSFQSHLKVLRYFKNRTRILFRGDSTLLDETKGLKTILRRQVLKWVYKHIDLALYVGANNRAYFIKHGVPTNKLLFAPHAIDNERFGNDGLYAESVIELKEKLSINSNYTVFLFVGKFEQKKNPLLLVKAFKQLNHHQAILMLVGNGKLEAEIKEEAKGADNIILLPFQNQTQMPMVYRVADVLVLPSKGPGETWGLCLNEAMACGLAIIASNKVGGAVDLIDNGRNGNIFNSDNLEELIDVLEAFAKMSKDMLREMGRFSAGKIEGWNYRHICNAIVNYINSN